MSRANSQIIDSVSASDLLKALNTLQKMNRHPNESEMSFCDQNSIMPQANNSNSKIINFQLYMAKKTDKSSNKSRVQVQQKSISPLKEHNKNQKINSSIQISNIKSRSHSPIFRKQQKIQRSFVNPNKKIQQNIRKKQNIKEENNIKTEYGGYRASFQSKKIMDEKQKKGVVYIPIQFRASELIKQKQIKLAKLQRQKEMEKILVDKECTFKPNIIKNYKKSKVTVKQQKQIQWIDEQTVRFECNNSENQFLCTPTNPMSIQTEDRETEDELFPNKIRQLQTFDRPQQKVSFKKYKNEKFNYLLDLIH